MKHILVTGGTGFIGNHLCRKLLSMGHYVICLDSNFTGSITNISDLYNYSHFEFIRHDITVPIYLEVDEIYHLACPASPKDYQLNGIKTIKTNILGTMHALGIAKRTKAKILLTSTSEVYGDPEESPQREDYWGNVNPVGIRSCYDEGKRVAETLMMEYKRNHNVDIRIARIFNTYGPYMNPTDGRVISNFINQCLENKDITIYGNGNQTRSFCYVSDMVDGLIKLMNTEDIEGPVNLGNPDEKTIYSVAQKIKSLIPESISQIASTDLPKDDPKKRKPDITKAITLLDWNPSVNFDEGIKKTIEYFKQCNEKRVTIV